MSNGHQTLGIHSSRYLYERIKVTGHGVVSMVYNPSINLLETLNLFTVRDFEVIVAFSIYYALQDPQLARICLLGSRVGSSWPAP
jgi:hypothetical protein